MAQQRAPDSPVPTALGCSVQPHWRIDAKRHIADEYSYSGVVHSVLYLSHSRRRVPASEVVALANVFRTS
jgi:hypothetical protein